MVSLASTASRNASVFVVRAPAAESSCRLGPGVGVGPVAVAVGESVGDEVGETAGETVGEGVSVAVAKGVIVGEGVVVTVGITVDVPPIVPVAEGVTNKGAKGDSRGNGVPMGSGVVTVRGTRVALSEGVEGTLLSRSTVFTLDPPPQQDVVMAARRTRTATNLRCLIKAPLFPYEVCGHFGQQRDCELRSTSGGVAKAMPEGFLRAQILHLWLSLAGNDKRRSIAR